MPRDSSSSLHDAVRSAGFTPRGVDMPELFELLGGEKREARHVERALARLGERASEQAMLRLPTAAPPLRARLCRLIARVGGAREKAFLVRCLGDTDPKTRKSAVIALGKLGSGDANCASALLDAWDREKEVDQRRAIAAALGKLGDARALERLRRDDFADRELSRIAREAELKIERTSSRPARGSIDATSRIPHSAAVVFHCRRGLEPLLADELEARHTPRLVGPGRIRIEHTGTLAELFTPRTALGFGFSLAVEPAKLFSAELEREAQIEAAVVAALTSDETWALLRATTRGGIRYRIEWASGGHRRALTWRVVRAVAGARPELVNDPTLALWELVVAENGERLELELRPRGLPDPRFAYRQRLVPAASHPTLAAALARVAGAQKDDVVWDPFVGSGSELVERAHCGPYRELYGSDIDARALSAARENLASAGVTARLTLGDARRLEPPRKVTLVVTNPPMGRRVLRQSALGELYSEFLAHVGRLLLPGGRLVWISPLPEPTVGMARRAGLTPQLRQRIDMGGFSAELQAFEKRRAVTRELSETSR